MPSSTRLRVLLVDADGDAATDLVRTLNRDERIAVAASRATACDGLALLHRDAFDAVLIDVDLPDLSGLELAAVVAHRHKPPAIVFVSAQSCHAVDAFELHAIDYLLKPVDEPRVRETVRRIAQSRSNRTGPPADPTIPVELGGITRFVRRADIASVTAQGDYVRLNTAESSHLFRASISELERLWSGFVRVHRSVLVSLRHIEAVRVNAGRTVIVAAGQEFVVSRRRVDEFRACLRGQGRYAH